MLVAVSAPVLAAPDTGRLPLQPPLATQLVALFDDQLSVGAEAAMTVAGFTDSATVGGDGGGASTITLAL